MPAPDAETPVTNRRSATVGPPNAIIESTSKPI
nr:MAG TPA: hypothetical protein [Microviridae sp.]